MKKLIGLLCFVILLAIPTWIGWTFQPWMPAGRAVHLITAHLGEYDFQVWQRKNATATEPFSTGLFARKQAGKWRVFLLDFQDSYHPQVVLRKESGGVTVLYGNEKQGFFDESQQTYKRESNGRLNTGITLDSEPPSDWLGQSLR